jgi:hypothetical protein
MGTELTVLNNQTAIQEGGLGVDFSNRLFSLKPANLFIVQNNSTIEGAIKGNLRIAETGDQFDHIYCTLLVMPTEQRQYHIGEPGELNRTPENLMCFSTDMTVPHPKARIPQAMNCASCPRADWGPWREYKEKNDGKTNKNLIPPCDAHYRALLIDDQYKLPLQYFIRSKAKEPFESGMQNLARVFAMMRAEGKQPNIFDVRFKLSTKLVTTGKFQSYVPVFSEFTPLTTEQREKFGAVYLQYIAQKSRKEEANAQAEAEAEVSAANESVNASVTEGEYIGEDKEIII